VYIKGVFLEVERFEGYGDNYFEWI